MKAAEKSAEALLAERIGLDPQTVGGAAISRALNARMAALGLHERDDYLRRLARSDDEQQRLIEEVVIPESWFFRDDRPFSVLRTYALERRDSNCGPAIPPLRLLSVPCACGEEPYSIAITLLDLGFTSGQFQIDAVDVSARHLAAAERGVYRANSFRGSDLTFRDRYFRAGPQAHSFTLDPSVRATVRFAKGNLLDPNLLSGQLPYDVIFCRNVLIYLDSSSRRRVFATLDRLLAPTGFLFVGHAERVTIDNPCFVPWGESANFTLRRTMDALPKPARSPANLLPPSKVLPPLAVKRPESGRPRRPAQASSTSLRTPSPSKPIPAPSAESSETLLDEAASLADQGRNDEAAARCEATLGRFGPNARAFFLLGLVRQATGRSSEAETCFRKTIYLEPDHEEALLALALIAQRRGDSTAAAGFRRRAERARAKKGTA